MTQRLFVVTVVALSLFAVAPALTQAATLTRSLDVGMSGSDVSALQTYLATDASLYPSGLVTGYFGQLTANAIQIFQSRNGIVSQGTPASTGYGRVGPVTLAAINARMGGVGSPVTSYVPAIYNLRVTSTANGATLTWMSTLPTRGIVHCQTSAPSLTEASDYTPAIISGIAATEPVYGVVHSVVLGSLQANTTYYYVVEGVTAAGHQDLVWPATLQTQ